MSQNKDSILLDGSRHFLFYHLWYRCEWVEEIYRAQTEIPITLLYMKFGLHNIPVVFKIFPLLTCI